MGAAYIQVRSIDRKLRYFPSKYLSDDAVLTSNRTKEEPFEDFVHCKIKKGGGVLRLSGKCG